MNQITEPPVLSREQAQAKEFFNYMLQASEQGMPLYLQKAKLTLWSQAKLPSEKESISRGVFLWLCKNRGQR